MANSVTNLGDLPIRVGRSTVKAYKVEIDTDEDVTIHTTGDNKIACIVGVLMSESVAMNLTLKSGATTHTILKLAENQGLANPIGGGVLFATFPGENLVMRASQNIDAMIVYVIEADENGIDLGAKV